MIKNSLNKMDKQNKYWLIVFFSALIMGTEAVLVKLSYAGNMSMNMLVLFRSVVGFICFSSAAIITKKHIFPEKKNVFRVLRAAFFNTLNTVFLFTAYSYLPAGLAILFFYVSPSFTIIFARLIYKEAIKLSRVLAITVAATGLILLFWTSAADISIIGVFYAILGAACSALYNVFVGDLLDEVPVETYASTQYLFATFFYIVIFAPMSKLAFDFTAGGAFWAVCVGIFATFIPIYMLITGMRYIGPVKASITYMLEAPTSVILAYFVFGDTLTPVQLLGAACILMGVAIPQIFDMVEAKKHIRPAQLNL